MSDIFDYEDGGYGSIGSRWSSDDSDGVDELLEKQTRRADRLRGHRLSSAWSVGCPTLSTKTDHALALYRVRDVVWSLLRIHGIPKDTRVELAWLGMVGKGASMRTGPGTNCPLILLPRDPLKTCGKGEYLDVYCGIGIHEASHLNHPELFAFLGRFGRSPNGHAGVLIRFVRLLEEERIERLAREESPGYGGYLDKMLEVLFVREHRELLEEQWPGMSDMDRVWFLAFALFRMPIALNEELESWVSLSGRHVSEEMRACVPVLPKTFDEVRDAGERLAKWFMKFMAYYRVETPTGPGESGSGETGSGEPGPGGSGSGGGESGDEYDGDESGGGVSGGVGTGSEGSESGGSDGPDSGGDESGVAGADKALRDMADRIRKELEADRRDGERVEEACKKAEKATPRSLDSLDREASMSGISESEKTETDREAEKSDRDVKSERTKVSRTRVGRFSTVEVDELLDKIDRVDSAMDVAESREYSRLLVSKTEFGAEWSHDDDPGTKRRTVIMTPPVRSDAISLDAKFSAAVRKHVARMRGALRFRWGTRSYDERELPEGRLDRTRLGRAAVDGRVFKSEWERSAMGLALCLLLDLSGSMRLSSNVGSKAYRTACAAELVARALYTVPAVELEIYSHDSCGSRQEDLYIRYLYGRRQPDIRGIGNYTRGSENYDHMAILTAADLFVKNTTNKRRLMLVISDGVPCGHLYGGVSAIRQTREAVTKVRRRGIAVAQIAIENLGDASALMFGKDYVVFDSLDRLVPDIGRLVSRIVREATK